MDKSEQLVEQLSDPGLDRLQRLLLKYLVLQLRQKTQQRHCVGVDARVGLVEVARVLQAKTQVGDKGTPVVAVVARDQLGAHPVQVHWALDQTVVGRKVLLNIFKKLDQFVNKINNKLIEMDKFFLLLLKI